MEFGWYSSSPDYHDVWTILVINPSTCFLPYAFGQIPSPKYKQITGIKGMIVSEVDL